ncbi:YbaB/EbfC family nucleoid-associated protein [Actinoplanes sp. NPDC051470]|uniref:YbaB/EbfC family nucleoid-associated protein n=1 Tax=unclassified Actinoplanes TaxID=2626549 RepID=UPI003424D2A3
MTAAGGPLDPDSALDYLQNWQGRIERMAADTQAMSDRLGELRVSAEDGDGIVAVTIDSTGVLADLRFTERVQRIAPDASSRAVLTALRAARLKAAERSRQIIEETVGPDSIAGRTIAERMEQQLNGGSEA